MSRVSAAHRPILIRGGRVIDPASERDEVTDVYLEDGVVKEVGPRLSGQVGRKAERVDAKGRWVVPGFVDLHTHLREPGHEYKETIATGSASAAAGGFTTILCMANTRPVNDTGTVTRYMVDAAAKCGLARVLPIGALSKGLQGEHLAEIADMLEQGAVAVSDDGHPVMNAHLMRRALEYCRPLGVPVIVHEEDLDLAAGGVMNEGAVSTRLGLPGLTYAAEDVMVARDLVLVELTGGHLHVAHVSTAGAVRMIREAQARGLHVTTEVTPHHFTLTDDAVSDYDPDTRMAPPLRAEEDRRACIEGLRDGTIGAIATDHAPHGSHEKCVEFELAAMGVVGLETSWGLTMKLVRDGEISENDAVRLLTSGPSGAFGLPYGTLSVGAAADVCIIDPSATTRVEAQGFESKSANTPFKGWDLPTRIERTVFGGRTVYFWDGRAGEVLRPE